VRSACLRLSPEPRVGTVYSFFRSKSRRDTRTIRRKSSASLRSDPHTVVRSTLVQVFHPNIDLEGNVCLNILREDWRPVLSIISIVHGLHYVLLVPRSSSYRLTPLVLDPQPGRSPQQGSCTADGAQRTTIRLAGSEKHPLGDSYKRGLLPSLCQVIHCLIKESVQIKFNFEYCLVHRCCLRTVLDWPVVLFVVSVVNHSSSDFSKGTGPKILLSITSWYGHWTLSAKTQQ